MRGPGQSGPRAPGSLSLTGGLDRKVTSPYAYFEAGQLYLTRERSRDEGDTHYPTSAAF